ncbi:MAG TPA: DUF1338 domain-containing protein [Bacteroidales bacterium]|nr:DUF1338 domain-containing protein [Bacteroidales bacterium]
MESNTLFNRLWLDYTASNPSARKIVDLFTAEGELVINDHIAFRTLDDPRISLETIARTFVRQGYKPAGEYEFKDKHLFARHYELTGVDDAPRIFISQLIMADVSPFIRKTLQEALDRVPQDEFSGEDLVFAKTLFDPLSYDVYSMLREESEYAAWFYVFGFRANHFTVSVNSMKKYDTLEKVNELLKNNGFVLNTSGGEIKGTSDDLLRQSSTMADIVCIGFKEGAFDIPCCYYEFAQRYTLPDGRLFGGFIARSADKIFESTNFYRRKEG